MSVLTRFEKIFLRVKSNRWYWLFALFCRISLAFAFIVAGFVKIVDERFASGLSELHPMGSYLEALNHTGYYYAFIGYVQVLAAILLLIPRTVLLGALLYFPIILNICILSYAVRFEGSMVTAPLMTLANLFLLVWNYDRLKFLLPIKSFTNNKLFQKPEKYSLKFPFGFLAIVLGSVTITVSIAEFGFDVVPRNSLIDCEKQFQRHENRVEGYEFCNCIHEKGRILDECLKIYEKSTE